LQRLSLESCGHIRSRFQCFFSLTLLLGLDREESQWEVLARIQAKFGVTPSAYSGAAPRQTQQAPVYEPSYVMPPPPGPPPGTEGTGGPGGFMPPPAGPPPGAPEGSYMPPPPGPPPGGVMPPPPGPPPG